jgi:hypothetical protein
VQRQRARASGPDANSGERARLGERACGTRAPARALVLVHVDPPFAGRELTIDDPDGEPSFTITYEQTAYVFARSAR